MAPAGKAEGAFRTIGEVATALGLPQHILRYWETRFPELKPLQRAGNRRYYRPADVVLATRIHRLLNTEGYTVRGVQQLLAGQPVEAPSPAPTSMPSSDAAPLREIRDALAAALHEDAHTHI